MDHIRITSSNFIKAEETIPDAFIAEDDLADIKRLAGVSNSANLNEYTGYNSIPKTQGSNVSFTANEKIDYQQQNNIQPGSPEWFRLWFSKPYLTGEKPF